MISYNLENALKEPKQVTSLVLYRRSLSDWPESLFQFPNLEHLELDQCGITHLDERLSLLPLQTLKLPRNEITALPSWLGRLSQLTHLDLSQNRIASWPEESTPPSLVTANLSDNRFHRLPDDLLTQIVTLDLNRNPLSRMNWPILLSQLRELHLDRSPAAATQLLNCSAPQMTNLSVTRSKIVALPDDWLSYMPNLITLNLTGNGLSTWPTIWPSRILPLERLILAKNHLSRLPEGWECAARLRDLDLSRNQLNTLPHSFANLSQLIRIDLSGNPIPEIPSAWADLPGLKSLDIRKTKIDSLPVGTWPRLEKLFIHQAPIAHRTDIFRSLPVRIRITGKAQARKQNALSLHGFRKKANHANWSVAYQDRIWQLAEGHLAGKQDHISITELLDLWSLGLTGIDKRLIRLAPGKNIKNGDQMFIFGRTWLPSSAFQRRAEHAGINLVSSGSSSANLILLGGPQGDQRWLKPGQQTWWSEEAILAKLPPLKSSTPMPMEHRDQVISLLRSGISTYHSLAIQSMIDHGIPIGLYGELLWIIRQDLRPALRRKWPELVMQYGQAEWVVDCLKPKKDLHEEIETLAKKWGFTSEAKSYWS